MVEAAQKHSTPSIKTTNRRVMEGLVISNKMNKTIVVQTVTLVKHAKYGKYFKKYKKLKAHDETNQCKAGDRVSIIESHPISKEKKFRLQRVIEKAKITDLAMA